MRATAYWVLDQELPRRPRVDFEFCRALREHAGRPVAGPVFADRWEAHLLREATRRWLRAREPGRRVRLLVVREPSGFRVVGCLDP
ncbi:MAG: hypothetical protein QN144_13705 [Armatimonadota bacterium]|nr:hypothetical protein [Armatimonadota bacterium]